ncbi:phage antirepressor KilAC domain-containing protein [Azospirillum thermophilum]|nr:phage antirepressor KilAC domain-containing protein [Azospirillum thermophilum]
MATNMTPTGGNGNGRLEPTSINGEPRIRDLDLAARLGFSDPHKIRNLIERHADALAALGISATVAETSPRGGRPGKAHYLNRKQAIFITAKSETPEATEITIEIIEKFDAYERGAVAPVDPMAVLNDPAAMRGLLLNYTEKVLALEEKVKEQAPVVEAYDRIANAEGSLSITEAAKALQCQRIKDLTAWLHAQKWIYRRAGNKDWLAHQDKLRAGLLEHKVAVVPDHVNGGDRVVERVRVTPAGLAHLAKKLGAPSSNGHTQH